MIPNRHCHCATATLASHDIGRFRVNPSIRQIKVQTKFEDSSRRRLRTAGKDEQHYAQSAEERDQILKNMKRKTDVKVTRFKGLGEMDAVDLEDTTMKAGKRKLGQVTIDEAFAATSSSSMPEKSPTSTGTART